MYEIISDMSGWFHNYKPRSYHVYCQLPLWWDLFYTNAEYETFTDIKIDVQSFTETTELYLLGRCLSNDEQLGYVETNTKCLKEFNERFHAGDISIPDQMRFFHGDGPAMQQGV